LRQAWWPAAAVVARLTGDLGSAEDAVQEACAQALERWPTNGIPDNPGGWLVAVARRRAVDQLRRDAARPGKERLAAQQWLAARPGPWTVARDDATTEAVAVTDDEQLALLFACCHPALDLNVRVVLTLRMVCGLPSASIARLLLLPAPTVAQRLVRAKRKIRDAGIRLRVPDAAGLPARLDAVLKVVYLTFTEGHAPGDGEGVVRPDLCDEALRLARSLRTLMPGRPEVAGLLALILLTAARTPARVDQDGAPVPLAEQDRRRWDADRIAEGRSVLLDALRQHQPGPTSCRPRSPPAMPTPPRRRTPTGARSPRCTPSCSGTSRRPWSRPTVRSRSDTPKAQPPVWPSWTTSPPAPTWPGGRSCTSPAPVC
jgi:RNA polymerase sigma-70 factor, ECF subfamily